MIDAILIVARLGLATIFLVAAVAKLADMPGSRAALAGFKVPATLVPAGSVTLPALEIASAALLVIAPTAQIGAALAVALLLVFVGGIAAALRRGARPDCHCFGQLHSKPAGAETLARNAALMAVGIFVLVAGSGPALDRWVSASSAEAIALASTSLLVVALTYISLSLWLDSTGLTRGRTHAPEASPLEIGETIPAFDATDASGVTVPSSTLVDGAPRSLLVFTSATCGPCVGLLPELARWQQMLVGRLAIHVLASGDETENRRLALQHQLPILLDRDGAAANAVGVLGTPSALALDAAGRVLALLAVGAPSIEGVIRVALKMGPTNVLAVHHVQGRLQV